MRIENFGVIELPPSIYKEDPLLNSRIANIVKNLDLDNQFLFTEKFFKDPDAIAALPEEVRNSDEKIAELIVNCEKFARSISSERKKRWDGKHGLLGEEVVIPETIHHDGRKRRAEYGYKIHVEYLKSIGIDPSKVLFFRITQPSDTPKPEYYWTSDYNETRQGLTAEIPSSQRERAIILIADLETINTNEGLIQDINDDQGLAVRQIGTGPFDQTMSMGTLSPYPTSG